MDPLFVNLNDESQNALVSVVVPAFNERDTLGRVVECLLSIPEISQIIVVDDGSEDPSRTQLTSLAGLPRVKIVHHEENQGKGAALRTGFAAATGDYVVVQDADLEYDPLQIPKLLEPLKAKEADVVYGSRYLLANGEHGPPVRRFANRLLTWLSNRMTGLRLTDMETGHKAFRSEVIRSIEIQENRFGVEPELTAKVAKGNWRVTELPIAYHPRTYREGKKIGWRDGVWAIWCIIRYRF